jgi:hypothetical protein
VPADVSAESVADGMERLLDCPRSDEACRSHARRFSPGVVLPQYRGALERAHTAALDGGDRFRDDPADHQCAAPDQGLLASTAPLTTMSWGQLFSSYLEDCDELRRSWAGRANRPQGPHLRSMLSQGTRAPVENFLSGCGAPPPSPSQTSVAPGAFIDQVAAAAASPGAPSTRVACLVSVWQAGRLADLRNGLDSLETQQTPAALVLGAEESCLAGDLAEGYERACHGLDLTSDDEVTAFRLRQVARIARAAGVPERALPWLNAWLERFPDSPESGPVWLDTCVNAIRAGGEHLQVAEAAFDHARALLCDAAILDSVEGLLFSAVAAAAVDD